MVKTDYPRSDQKHLEVEKKKKYYSFQQSEMCSIKINNSTNQPIMVLQLQLPKWNNTHIVKNKLINSPKQTNLNCSLIGYVFFFLLYTSQKSPQIKFFKKKPISIFFHQLKYFLKSLLYSIHLKIWGKKICKVLILRKKFFFLNLSYTQIFFQLK